MSRGGGAIQALKAAGGAREDAELKELYEGGRRSNKKKKRALKEAVGHNPRS